MIAAAAMRLFTEHGFDAVTIAQITLLSTGLSGYAVAGR